MSEDNDQGSRDEEGCPGTEVDAGRSASRDPLH